MCLLSFESTLSDFASGTGLMQTIMRKVSLQNGMQLHAAHLGTICRPNDDADYAICILHSCFLCHGHLQACKLILHVGMEGWLSVLMLLCCTAGASVNGREPQKEKRGFRKTLKTSFNKLTGKAGKQDREDSAAEKLDHSKGQARKSGQHRR